ncbi:MAG: hypothetical protein KA072_01870 [Thermoanaerobaculaceae bacterium]|nr:hypothetical protein [Thermoanaerobaculaceae bacterium]MDI9621626.1 hypothetical protein [Acidobacteriota bacterium]
MLIVAAGQPAGSNLQVKADINRASLKVRLAVTTIDPRFGWAAEHTAELMRAGVEAVGIEARIEDMPPAWPTTFDIIIVHDDRPWRTAMLLQRTVDFPRNLISYIHVRFPDGALYSIATSVRNGDTKTNVPAALLLAEIEANAAPGNDVFNGRNAVNKSAAALVRAHLRTHNRDVLTSMVTNTPLERHAIEVSVSGHDMLPMVIEQRPLGAADPQALAEKVAAENPSILEHGRGFVVAELIPGGLRFHEVYIKPDGTGVFVVKTRTVLRTNLTGRLCVAG